MQGGWRPPSGEADGGGAAAELTNGSRSVMQTPGMADA